MLVLSRKIGEKIHVGNDITIEVRRVAGNRVTLAVDAPRNVRILRSELKDAALDFENVESEPDSQSVVVAHQRLGGMPTLPQTVS